MTRSITLAAVALVTTLALASDSNAQQQKFLLVENNPAPAIQPHVQPGPVVLPKFGFQSYNIHGYGERVTFVNCHGIARHLGLEPGDTILSLNGFPLTFHGAWNQALSNAVMQGGSVSLAIRDVRTGAVVYRNTFVGGTPGYGPITPKSMPVGNHGPVVQYYQQPQIPVGTPGPITQKSVPGNGSSKSKNFKINSGTIQALGKLFD